MRTWSRRWQRVWPQGRRAVHRPRYRPILESLEERCLLNSSPPIIPSLTPTPQLNVSTVPANGDVNPYGVAFVPPGFAPGGPLHPGDILVSNFNNSANQQGTGTTIVDISPDGTQSLFFQGSSKPGKLGLTTALGVLKSGFVLVGSVPTLDGTSATVQAPGSLLILNRFGHVVTTLRDAALLDGPWDLAVNDQGDRAQVFVSNVLSGTVTRIDLQIPDGSKPIVESETRIASGYLTRTDPAALLVGPTGLAYDAKHDILYVASTGDNAIFAIRDASDRTGDAGMGRLVYQDNVHLHGPLGLVLAPNGDLISAQGDAVNSDPNQPSELVEFTPRGQFVAQMPVDASGQQGGAFGVALEESRDTITFAAVDDITNTLEVWTIPTHHKPGHRQGDREHGEDASTSAARGSLRADADGTAALMMAPADSRTRAIAGLTPGGPPVTASSQALAALPSGEDAVMTSRLPALDSALGRAAHRQAVDVAFANFGFDLQA